MRRWIILVLLAEAACSKNTLPAFGPACAIDYINCGDNPAVSCDNRDELCKCGPVQNGLVCPPGSACTPQGADVFTCVSTLCDQVSCERGQSCNPTTGQCACGEGESARTCSTAQTCVNGRCTPGICDTITCQSGETCDPYDGTCKCGGPGGVVCQQGQSCTNGTCSDFCGAGTCPEGQYCKGGSYCAPDPCYGVNCPTLNKCSHDDGLCHCIGADDSRPPDGPICTGSERCVDDGSGGKCFIVEPCSHVSCPSGAVCDPDDGSCRCGGIGPDYPICGPEQSCDLATSTCVSGHPCQGVKCDVTFPGTSCDEEDGYCKCGGTGGTRCRIGDVCLPVSGALTCVSGCDPLADTCGGGDACYFDPVKNLAACLPQGFTAIGATCKDPSDCVAHATCATQSGDKKTCVAYCDRTRNGADCPVQALCIGLDTTPGSNLGQCYTF